MIGRLRRLLLQTGAIAVLAGFAIMTPGLAHASDGSESQRLTLPRASAAPIIRDPYKANPGLRTRVVKQIIAAAEGEVGTSRATGWNQPGECIVSVRRWIHAGDGTFKAAGVVTGYTLSGAHSVPLSRVRPGDVIQYQSLSAPNEFAPGVHTVLVTGINQDKTLQVIQSNVGFTGTVSADSSWTPDPPPGFTAIAWSFPFDTDLTEKE